MAVGDPIREARGIHAWYGSSHVLHGIDLTIERGEIEELIRRAKSQSGGRIPVIAGSGTNSTAGSVALSRAAEAAGAPDDYVADLRARPGVRGCGVPVGNGFELTVIDR